MTRRSTKLLKGLLSALHYSGADRLVAPLTRGVGAIFTLHHVHSEPPAAFEPNRILRVTPQFLEQAIAQIRESGFEIISLDDAHLCLLEKDFRPFACLTFDDGYRDNLEVAYPIFKRHNLPFAVYICTDFADGRGDLWWLALEKAVLRTDSVSLRIAACNQRGGKGRSLSRHLLVATQHQGRRRPRRRCRALPGDGLRPERSLPRFGDDLGEIRFLAADPLVTIGAHTRRHLALAKLTLPEARDEIAQSLARIERELGVPCRHLSYPYGDERSAGEREFQLARELGFRTGVTTRKGLIQRRHTSALTGLPRVSLNGDYQQARYVKVSLNGVPFAFANRRQRPAGQTAPFH